MAKLIVGQPVMYIPSNKIYKITFIPPRIQTAAQSIFGRKYIEIEVIREVKDSKDIRILTKKELEEYTNKNAKSKFITFEEYYYLQNPNANREEEEHLNTCISYRHFYLKKCEMEFPTFKDCRKCYKGIYPFESPKATVSNFDNLNEPNLGGEELDNVVGIENLGKAIDEVVANIASSSETMENKILKLNTISEITMQLFNTLDSKISSSEVKTKVWELKKLADQEVFNLFINE